MTSVSTNMYGTLDYCLQCMYAFKLCNIVLYYWGGVLQLLMSCWLGRILCYEDSFSILWSYLVVKQTIYCNNSERVSTIEISIICKGNNAINVTMPTIITLYWYRLVLYVCLCIYIFIYICMCLYLFFFVRYYLKTMLFLLTYYWACSI